MDRRPDFRQSVAVVIGVDAYGHGVPPLRTAAADARRLGQLLADDHGYDVRLLLDERARLGAITGLLTDDLPRVIGPDDRVLFYFAGHGVALEGDGGPTGYLLPQDARRGAPETYLHMPALYDALCALECRHMLVILDSCFSGAFRWSATRDLVALPAVIHQERYDRFVLDPAWQAIASASHDQTALDELPGTFGDRGSEGGHSPFARALFDALAGAGDVVPAGAGDGVITASELYLYLEQALQPATLDAGHRQTPRLWPLAKHDKGEFIFLAPGHEIDLPPAPPLTAENNPWRGLESYDEAHAELFFGRDGVVESLRRAVEARPLTVVLGASGTGKSSVVKAGLIPRLLRDVAHEWRVLPVVRPGAEPMRTLDRAASGLGTGEGAEEAVAGWCRAHPEARLVLVVDQLEELVTMTRQPAEREAALRVLLRLVEAHPEQVRVVLTLRSDFEPQFDRSALSAHWPSARAVVPPMTQAEVREVIERPASQRVLYFEPHGLVDALIDEVIQTPGGLPLLSFALSEMYLHYLGRRSDDRAIETQDYDAVGGVVGALRTRADAELAALDPARRGTLRRLMLRMVAVEGGSVARRRVPRSEIEYPDPAETERAAGVVRQLTAARLVVEGRGEDGEPYVEPAHDALVRAWDRLLGWIHEEQDRVADLRFQHALTRAARDWAQADDGAKAGLLWRDAARGGVLAHLVAREEEALRSGPQTLGRRRRARALGPRPSAPRGAGDGAVWMNRRELAFARRSIRRRRNIRLGPGALVLLIVAGAAASTVLGLRAVAQEQIATANAAEADRQRRQAEANAARAERNAEEARDNAAEADRQQRQAEANAEEAQDNADRAERNAAEAERQERAARQNAAEARAQTALAEANAAEAQARFLAAEAAVALQRGDRAPAFRLAQAAWAATPNDATRATLRRLRATVLPLATVTGEKVAVPDATPLVFTTEAIYDGQGRLVDRVRADRLAFSESGAYFLAVTGGPGPVPARTASYVLHDGPTAAPLAAFGPGCCDLPSHDGRYALRVRDVEYGPELWMTWELADASGRTVDVLRSYQPVQPPPYTRDEARARGLDPAQADRMGPFHLDSTHTRVTLRSPAGRALLAFRIDDSEGGRTAGTTAWVRLADWQNNRISDFAFLRTQGYEVPMWTPRRDPSLLIGNEPDTHDTLHLRALRFHQSRERQEIQYSPATGTVLLWDQDEGGTLWSLDELRRARWLDGTFYKVSRDGRYVLTRDGDDVLVWDWSAALIAAYRAHGVFLTPDLRRHVLIDPSGGIVGRAATGDPDRPFVETFALPPEPPAEHTIPQQVSHVEPDEGVTTVAYEGIAYRSTGGDPTFEYTEVVRVWGWDGRLRSERRTDVGGAPDPRRVHDPEEPAPVEWLPPEACGPEPSLCAVLFDKEIVVTSEGGAAWRFDLYEHGRGVLLSPGGGHLLGVTRDGRAKLWEVDAGFSPDAFIERYRQTLRPLTAEERRAYALD